MSALQITLVVGVSLLAVAGLIAMRLAAHSSRVYEGPELTPYDLALLAGGPARLADTALVSLTTAGSVRARRDGRLSRVSGRAERVDHPVEAEILAMVDREADGLPVWTIRGRVISGPAVEAQVARLRELGLIDPPGSGRADPTHPNRAGQAALAHHRLRYRENRTLPPRPGERAVRDRPEVVDVALYGLSRVRDGRLSETLSLDDPRPAPRPAPRSRHSRRGGHGGGDAGVYGGTAAGTHGTGDGGWGPSGGDGGGGGGGDGGGGGGGGGGGCGGP
ncbi:TIGR04222 domain-containing membrane protein [Streptosporangium sp. NPDC050855]|uniref:TIGR04222 domain-containing membrane protein n=1 Tax=Streptosporangium sp. NPDC050855 TaxID=3366194 RepID=UPI0037AC3C68